MSGKELAFKRKNRQNLLSTRMKPTLMWRLIKGNCKLKPTHDRISSDKRVKNFSSILHDENYIPSDDNMHITDPEVDLKDDPHNCYVSEHDI